MIEANNPQLKSFISISADCHFPIQNLPFGVFSTTDNNQRRMGVAIGDLVLDIATCLENGLLDSTPLKKEMAFEDLNALMKLGRKNVTIVRNAVSELLRDSSALKDNETLKSKVLHKQSAVTMHLPAKISGYTDFYSSKEHATNIGTLFRDKNNPLLPNWVHIPVAYDGRAGSIIVSDQDIKRPQGQTRPNLEEPPVFGKCKGLDVEVEIGVFVGTGTELGDTISMEKAPEHIFGMVLLNDWSARDIQKWEYVPLGPFLGKNFATSISPWVVTLDALEPFRVAAPKQDPKVLDYLARKEDWAVNLELAFGIQTPNMDKPEYISHTNFKYMYWDIAQQLTHHSINGCAMNTGDLFGSGTISGPTPDSYGSMIEMTEGGKNPIKLNDGSERVFLKDGDTAVITGFCQADGYRVGFGSVSGKIVP
ncbi:MAG: fumarylacetoacetase [Francisella sp.]|jgi:fumarylacetoacetase